MIGFVSVFSACDNTNNIRTNLLYKKTVDSLDYHYYGKEGDWDSLVVFDKSKRIMLELYEHNEKIRTLYFYGNQKIKEMMIRKDSIIKTPLEEVVCCELFVSYDEYENIKEKGCQGLYEGKGVPVGTWFKYENGKVAETTHYYNDVYGKDYILIRRYKENGAYEEKIYNNFVLYENDSVRLINRKIWH